MIRAASASFFFAIAIAACSNSSNPQPDGGGACSKDLSVGWTGFDLCAAGTGGNLGPTCPAVTPPPTCVDTRPVAACCTWAADPTTELARAPSSLHYYGQPSGQPAVDVSCTTTPPVKGTSQMVTLNGFVKVFLGGDSDSAGVKIEIFQEGTDGALGASVGPAVTTDTSSPQRTNDWLQNCPTDGCIERAFSFPNVPTNTALIIHTSDANNAGRWASLYDYNIYFADSVVNAGAVSYDTTAVGTTDLTTVASSAGGYTIQADKGLLAGEVHDCGDVRLANATVSTDYRPQSPIVYFGAVESNPLPDQTQTSTSQIGLFGGINYTTNVPIHISAVGMYQGAPTLIGAYTVQTFPGAVTALSLRGRRPYQIN
jgi:hypothetical protein